MQTIQTILFVLYLVVQFVIASYLLVPFVFFVLYFFKKAGWQKDLIDRKPLLTNKEFEFAVIITAHEETDFITPLVDSLLKQSYQHFHAYVVADACDVSGLRFNAEKVTVLSPKDPLNSKIRSISYGLSKFHKKYDALIILDADNLVHPDFLATMNIYFQKGYRVVQADFKPKNSDTLFAKMDAIGDMFNFFVERQARMELGLSAAIWGSGVAIDVELYKEVSYTNLLGGFDKKLQSHLVQSVDQIAFAREAILFDEKVTSGKSLEKQRTRWISSYFKYFKESLIIFWRGIKELKINYIHFGFIILRPPLFLIIGSAFIFLVINYFLFTNLFIIWLVVLALFLLSFIGIIVYKGKSIKYLFAFFMLPSFMLRQSIAIFKIKKAKKEFLKTKHNNLVFIDDILTKSH